MTAAAFLGPAIRLLVLLDYFWGVFLSFCLSLEAEDEALLHVQSLVFFREAGDGYLFVANSAGAIRRGDDSSFHSIYSDKS